MGGHGGFPEHVTSKPDEDDRVTSCSLVEGPVVRAQLDVVSSCSLSLEQRAVPVCRDNVSMRTSS